MFRRRSAVLIAVIIVIGVAALFPGVRSQVRALVRPESPPPITPLAQSASSDPLPTLAPSMPPTVEPSATQRPRRLQPSTVKPSIPPLALASRTPVANVPVPMPSPSPVPSPVPTISAGPVVVHGRTYDAYIPAALKEHQAYKYSCEFDAAWVIFKTFGYAISEDEMIAVLGADTRLEPYIEETSQGFIIHGGDITRLYSGNYKENFLARSSGSAMQKVFEHYGFQATPVHDRAGIEQALRAGALIWMKTTVDFNKWRPALWITPEGQTIHTVLGNDHAVVVIGFNATSVVIRDVLGPTSSNYHRPYEYEVDWDTFMRTWEAQEFDGLIVAPPAQP
jgi:hypothetical protein